MRPGNAFPGLTIEQGSTTERTWLVIQYARRSRSMRMMEIVFKGKALLVF